MALGGSMPSYLSTHPALAERVRDMEVRVSRLPERDRGKKDDDVRFLRVQALIRARYADAEPALQTFAKQIQGPERCMALMGMGILCSRQNRVKDAAGYFESALSCDPADELIVREAGSFHYLKGNKSLGGDLLRKAVGMNPNDTYALYYHARDLSETGQTDQAVDYAQRVLRKEPEDPELHELLARLYSDKRKMFEANLHMAYSALYSNDKNRIKMFHEKAKSLALSAQEKQTLERFEQRYKERKEFW